jgi:hypothetical protein
VTEIPEEYFMEMLKSMQDDFTPQKYNILTNNCNNFTDAVANLLLGEGIPKDIVDLPQQLMETPMGKQFAPMLTSMQDNLMQRSNPIFENDQQNQSEYNQANPPSQQPS